MTPRSSLTVATALAIAGTAAGACTQLYDLSALGPASDDAGAGSDTSTSAIDAGPHVCLSGEGPPMLSAGSFCIDSTEVTNDQYVKFLEERLGTDAPPLPSACAFKKSFTPQAEWPPAPTELTLPVRHVDWCDALSYCTWAKKRLCGRRGAGPGLRPNQAVDPALSEWAFACTGGNPQAYPYGASYEAGRCNVQSDAALSESSRCAGGFPGLLDMAGNVAEWIDACETTNGSFDDCPVAGGSFLSTGASAACDASAPAARGGPRRDQGIRCCSR